MLMKYARLESERRLLLDAVPELPWERTIRLTDRYVHGTRLRVRLVEEVGADPVYKLGQKLRLDESAPSTNAHTTLYLDEREYLLLRSLPAAVLTKTRHLYVGWAVDVHASGLVLAETEGSSDPPFAFRRDVTAEERYTGAALSR